MKLCLYLCLCLLALTTMGHAQKAADKPTPPDPQVPPLPDYISFKKDFKYPPQKPSNPNASPEDKKVAEVLQQILIKLQRLEVVKTGDVRIETQSYTSGLVQQVYRQGTLTCIVDCAHPDDVDISAPWMTVGTQSGSAQTSDFPELSWITAASFQGIQEQQGQKVYFYKSGEQEAEIDVTTRLPLHARTPDLEVWYTYRSTPTEKLVLPAKFVKKIEAIKRGFAGAPH